jgi:hypothetical protein
MYLKYLTLLALLCFSISSFSEENADGQVNCEYSLEDFLVMELVDQIEGQSRFNAKVEAVKIVQKQCQSMKDKGDKTITIIGGEVRISDFSDRWDGCDDSFFCKNSAGYESQVNQIVQKIVLFSREKERKKREAEYKKNPPKKRKAVAKKSTQEKEPPLWRCKKVFFYLYDTILYDKDRMLGHINAHGKDSCKRAN